MRTILKSLLKALSVTLILYSCQGDDKLVVPRGEQSAVSRLKSGGRSYVPQSERPEFLAESNTKFAFNIFKKVASSETKSNFMISPLALSNTLAMAYNGAQAVTEVYFYQMLNYGSPIIEVNKFYKDLMAKVSANAEGLVMKTANSIWLNSNKFTLKQRFLDVNKKYYEAKVGSLDFSASSSKTTINNWVSGRTDNKITRIVRKINPNDDILLVNALYFKAPWKYKFDNKLTKKQPFYYGADKLKHKKVKMMNMKGNLAFSKNDLFQSVILPYKDDKFSMVVLVPNEGKTVKDIISEMNFQNWNNWLGAHKNQDIELNFPKFKLRDESELKNGLIKMGFESIAFTPEANFYYMARPLNAKISKVLHKTAISVNEKGTKKPVILDKSSSIPTFNVNKPFIYVIKENSTSSICLIGKMAKPRHRLKKYKLVEFKWLQ